MKKLFKPILFIAFIAVIVCLAAISVSANNNAQGESEERFGYTLLSDNEKYVYDKLYEGISAYPPAEEIELDYAFALELEELEKAFSTFVTDHPEFFWIENSYSYSVLGTSVVSINPQYHFTVDELTEAKAEFDQKTAEIMSGLPAGSNYDKALYLHDALANAVTYKQVGLHQTAYGALVDGEAVCAGYAAAYQHLLRCAGINASTITGYSIDPNSKENIPHAWNIVWMDADTCVYTDVTWDDQSDSIYHYYFNISRAEIEEDHSTNTQLHVLPECNHANESYFDKNDCNVSSDITPEDMAHHFSAPDKNDVRSAVVYYTGEKPLDEWLENNISDLYIALGGKPGAYSYGYSSFGNEHKITVKGHFTVVYHNIVINLPEHVSMQDIYPDQVADGDYFNIVIKADYGYYFPSGTEIVVPDGCEVYVSQSNTVVFSGRPRSDVTLTLPSPTEMGQEAMPNVVFTATGSHSGILTGITQPIKVSYDGETWYYCSDEALQLTNISACTLAIVTAGSESTMDSDPQYIVIEKFNAPDLAVSHAGEQSYLGSISSSSEIEISSDGINWSIPAKTVGDLTPGDYAVRIPANGSTLASDAICVTLTCMHALPDQWQTDANYHHRSCYCGEATESFSHSFSSWEEILDGGVSTGKAKRTCTVCGTEQTGSVTINNGSNSNKPSSNTTLIENGSHIGNMKTGCGSTISGVAYIIAMMPILGAVIIRKKSK